MYSNRAIIIAAIFTASCATVPRNYVPIVDTQDQAKYAKDVAECQSFARQIDAANSAAIGAVAGALLGVAVGALFGLRGHNLAQVAGTGAVVGGVNTGAYAGMTQIQIIQRCMAGRGYNVLG